MKHLSVSKINFKKSAEDGFTMGEHMSGESDKLNALEFPAMIRDYHLQLKFLQGKEGKMVHPQPGRQCRLGLNPKLKLLFILSLKNCTVALHSVVKWTKFQF